MLRETSGILPRPLETLEKPGVSTVFDMWEPVEVM